MSQRIVCDTCGETIDQSVTYYTASVQTVQIIDGVLTSAAQADQRDYHSDHLPGPHPEQWTAGDPKK